MNPSKQFQEKEIYSMSQVNKYFAADSLPFVLGPENQWYVRVEHVKTIPVR
jgi:hypothetical protein